MSELDVDPRAALFAALRRAADAAREFEDAIAGRHGLHRTDAAVLMTVLQPGGPDGLSPTDLARQHSLSTSAMTSLLDRLETAGLVTRRRHPDDRRRFVVTSTDQARDVVQRSMMTMFGEVDAAMDRHDPNDIAIAAAVVQDSADAVSRSASRLHGDRE